MAERGGVDESEIGSIPSEIEHNELEDVDGS
ncbi:hypothetical protein SEA_PHINKY_51 [Microbacterium phage Phinky]|nr:hypothetical protein SEA_PHINKY_51 [Microbacterium phage Phinky]